MKRRSTVSGGRAKSRNLKATKRKRSSASDKALSSASPHVSAEAELARLTRELTDERRQRMATSEVLRLLSGSHRDLNHLFDTILANATNLCQANFGTLSLCEGDAFRIVAMHNVPSGLAELRRREPLVRAGPLLHMAQTKRLLHIADYAEYVASHPADSDAAAFSKLTGVRTTLEVPMLKEDDVVGAIVIYRKEVRRFDDREIALIKDFAAQAVIAIENARLLNELRQRTTDLTEALEQQTATSEVLQVISSSPGDLQPVFGSMLENAVRICDATFGNIYRWDGEALHLLAAQNTPPAFAEARKRLPRHPSPNTPAGRTIATRTAVHVADLAAEQAYVEHHDPATVEAVELGGVRTFISVPLLKEDELIGTFSLARQEIRPFSDKQIALVTNFAAQAVIAIENARLLNELRQRTTDLTERTVDLTEALEQQTAASEVLHVISSSPGDLERVFATMLANAARICDAKFGNIFRWDGDAMHLVATHNTPPAFAEYRKRRPLPLKPNLPFGRMVEAKAVVHCADAAALPAYTEQRDPDVVAAVELGGIRTFVAVPMLTENKLIGALIVYRQDVRPFTDKQIELVKNFAAQAVIAIENARLLNELRQSLEQQTATSQVLQVISSSPSDLQHIFATILENATRICEAKFGALYLNEGDGFRATAMHNAPPDYEEARAAVVHPPPSTSLWRAANTKRPSQITDITSEPGYAGGDPFIVSAVALGGYRSVLSVPMLHEGELVGVITIFRQEVRSFSETHVSLVENFAAQAVIAIENARLLNDLRERTQQLEAQSQEVEKLNQQLEQRVADQVGEIERMGRLRRFLPPQVADLIVASGSEKQLESHRREITALFCDLRGFTGFTESADAEDVMALLRDYHAAIGEIIIKYNGTLERYAGDGVMVVFNDPVPVENPALQAVLMALEVRDAIGALTETWRRWGHDIGFGIGIAHGFATLGTIGFEGRFDYAAIGTVSNVASRLCDEAKPGQILISPRVLTKVENAVKVEPVGEFELKGIRRPLAAYNVVGPSRSNED
jgi:GAF domain-containing protein